MISSLEERKRIGIYHIGLKARTAKKAAVQRRNLTGVIMSGAKALPRRNSR
jgi:hypothetical protein